jgi:hypothetical protein
VGRLGLLSLTRAWARFEGGTGQSVQKNGPSVCVEVWFDFFVRPKGGSDDRGLACVLLYAFAFRLMPAVSSSALRMDI